MPHSNTRLGYYCLSATFVQGSGSMTTQPTEGCRNLELVWSPALTFEIRDVGGADASQWPRYYTPPPFAIVYVVDR